MSMVHGGRLVAQGLKRHGITHLFTMCGGHIQAIYDGCLDEQIRVVDVRHEQTAGHAADGYARVTGRPGVCAVTAGQGIGRKPAKAGRMETPRAEGPGRRGCRGDGTLKRTHAPVIPLA